MKRIIAAILAVVVLAGVALFALDTYKAHVAEQERLTALSDRLLQLNARKSNLERTIKDATAERTKELRYGNYMVFFFDSLSENLVDDVYPLLDGYGYKGTIVMHDGAVPGDEGKISRKNFEFLLDKGWDIAIGQTSEIDMTAKNAPELLGEYLDGYMARLEEEGIEVPQTFCFDRKGYNKQFLPVLKERGFKIIRHYGETGETYAGAIGEEFFYVSTGLYCEDETALQKHVDDAYEKKMTYTVSTRYVQVNPQDIKQDCSVKKYSRMLAYMEKYCPDMVVCTVSELYDYKLELLTTLDGVVGEYNEIIFAVEKELHDVQAEIDEINKEIADR